MLSVLFTSVALAQPTQHMGATNTVIPTHTLSVRMHQIHVQLATTQAQREKGLMHTPHLQTNHGMLFVFPTAGKKCFWMKNTHIPLDAAFIDQQGVITNIAHMQALDETSHCSTKAVGYVLEVNQGWFKKRKIGEGDRIRHLPSLMAAD